MGAQFDRLCEVQIGTTVVPFELDLTFKVVRTLKKEPNTAEVVIYNLRDATRGAISETADQTIQIKAGYRGRPSRSEALAAVDEALGTGADASSAAGVIFLGDVREVHNTYFPPDWETYVEGGDGERQTRTARVNRSFAPGTSVSKVIQTVAADFDVNLGNAAKRAIAAGSLEGAGREFLNGVTVSGSAHRELAALMKSAGLEMSVQNGVVQVLERGATLQDVSVVLTSDTGLVGSPEVGDKGIVKFRALLNPDIVPGRQIELASRTLDGRFRAERCEYTGETRGQAWYVDVEAKAL